MAEDAFEELAARELDGLYQEALFLTGGSEEAAEEILSRTFARSFQAFLGDDADPEGEDASRWLEGRLVREFLKASGGRSALREGRERDVDAPSVSGDPPDPDDLDPTALYRAAAGIPRGARAVLWLILFGRWTYGEVEELLGIDRRFLRDLMQYRHVLLRNILQDGWGRTGGARERAAN